MTQWLMKTSDSCAIVAALIATVAFATMASVPDGTESNGDPVLQAHRMFKVFSTSSLGALCFSLTAVVMFLAILTSQHKAKDFGKDLPTKRLIGLTALFLSKASVLVSFCGGYFFVPKDVVRDVKTIEYVVAVIPVIAFAVAQFPLYFMLILATIKKVPERGFTVITGGGERRGGLTGAEASSNLRITTTIYKYRCAINAEDIYATRYKMTKNEFYTWSLSICETHHLARLDGGP
ncbi:hypothetical protein ACSBR2_031974 [Camellia fascicularis]